MKPTKQSRGVAAALFLIALAGGPAGAGEIYYQWIDDQGTTVSSDRPPPAGVHYEVISTGPSLHNPARVSDNQNSIAAQAPLDNKLEGESPAAEQNSVKSKDPEACESATKNLQTLNTAARIRIPDGKGNYRYIDEEEKAAEREKAQAIMSRHCD